MKLKRVKDFLTESNIFEGDFTVTEDMISDGMFIEGKIPRIINGEFFCSNLGITTLEGGPKKVNGDFDCYNNRLTSLEFGPDKVNGDFNCSHNQLTSLEFCPDKVDGHFNCSYNILNSLEFGPKIVNGVFFCFNNVNNLDIEKEFILSGSFKNNYYKNLLDYMLSNNINLEEVESWPEGFITNNLKRSVKSKNKFNL